LQVFVRREQEACDETAAAAIARAEGLSMPVAQLLCGRGMVTPEAVRAFLHPDVSQLHDPMRLPDMEAAAARIRQAIARREKICVYCDYDADGICGGSALYRHLKSMGADADIFAPNRHMEGYGLSTDAVRRIAAGGVTLIVTVDCGVTNVAEVKLARELGVDVIVTDHHECGEALPDTPWIINPKRGDSSYPFAFLAGCGVAFKLVCALSSLEDALGYADLIAIGTITDIVPLLDENRVLAHIGLIKLRERPSPGIAALAAAAGITLAGISSQGVSFGLGPRINAAGRMDTAQDAITLLSAIRPGSGLDYPAKRLCELNELRRKEVDDIASAAESMVMAEGYYCDAAIVLSDRRWNPGVIGIAAARIAEKFTRPCLLLGNAGGRLTGSARSAGGVNIYEALAAFADRYEKFGGHAQAAGLTLRGDDVDALRRDVCAYISAHYGEEAFAVEKLFDMKLCVGDITQRLVEDLDRLEPFGACNEKPAVCIEGARLEDARFVGKNGQSHLKFTMRQNGAAIEAVRFFHKASQTFVSQACDFIAEPGINDYNGKPQVVVRDLKVRFDGTLTEGYIEANRKVCAERFLDETALPEPPDCGEAAFVKRLEAQLPQSRFSLCVEAGTEPALRRLLSIGAVREALESGRLCLYDPLVFTLDNCVAAALPPGFDRVLRVCKGEGSALWDGGMREGYGKHAAAFYLEREALLEAYRKLNAACAKPGAQATGQCMGFCPEREAFALRVLAELGLIKKDSSGKIQTIPHSGPKKELRCSACYARIEDMTYGR
jgi:single-stranded-DNA-specific exonuclease